MCGAVPVHAPGVGPFIDASLSLSSSVPEDDTDRVQTYVSVGIVNVRCSTGFGVRDRHNCLGHPSRNYFSCCGGILCRTMYFFLGQLLNVCNGCGLLPPNPPFPPSRASQACFP